MKWDIALLLTLLQCCVGGATPYFMMPHSTARREVAGHCSTHPGAECTSPTCPTHHAPTTCTAPA